MATFSDEIQSCILRSFCPPHAIGFERFHTKFPLLQERLESLEADASVLVWIFQPYPQTMTCRRWESLDKYIKSEEGQEYRSLCRHWARYAKLCLEDCPQCYQKAEGSTEEIYVIDRAYAIAGSSGEARERMKKRYPENYGEHLLREARKRKRLVDDWEGFLQAPGESQGSI